MRSGKAQKMISTFFVRLVLILFSVIVLLPILWTVVTSFKTSAEF